MTTKISEQQYCEIVRAIADNSIVDKHDQEYAISYNSIFSTLSEQLKTKLDIEVERSQIDECDWNPITKYVPIQYLNNVVVVKIADCDDSLSSYTIAKLVSTQPLLFKTTANSYVENAKSWKLLYNFSA